MSGSADIRRALSLITAQLRHQKWVVWSRIEWQRGFTLLEVTIALVLASMVAVAVGSMYAVMLRAMVLSSRMVQAQGIAERMVLSAAARPCEWEGTRADVIADQGVRFTRHIDVVATAVGNAWRLWRYDATVSWVLAGRRYDARLLVHDQADFTCPQWSVR